MSICLVSAFLDIGRGDWSAFRRSIDHYFQHFKPYTQIPHPMVVFMDDVHVEKLRALCQDAKHIQIIPINRDWMREHIYAYSRLDREREIMESDTFKGLIKHRLHHPECSQPEYNIMQHAKIDFVVHVITNKIVEADYYAWTDFGFFQDPSRICTQGLQLDKFNLERVNFQGIHPLINKDRSIGYTLIEAPERVGGFFYLGRPDLLLRYQELYHQVCLTFHSLNIVDDDQHIMIQCTFLQPDLFYIWVLGKWHMTYLHFATESKISN
jgi:protein YibB